MFTVTCSRAFSARTEYFIHINRHSDNFEPTSVSTHVFLVHANHRPHDIYPVEWPLLIPMYVRCLALRRQVIIYN